MNSIKWHLAHGRHLELGPRSQLMGILNVTPDSFSDGGKFIQPIDAVGQAMTMIEEGASIIDIGGESTRPGARPIDAATEQRRIMPIVAELAGQTTILLSVDTYRTETARKAIAAGAHIINDVSGLQGEPDMARAIAESGAGIVIMHTNRGREVKLPPIEDQFAFLSKSLEIAERSGIRRDAIVLDPGFGFGKDTTAINLELMAHFERLQGLGYPLLVGTSRKRLLGSITGLEPRDRDTATAATSAILRLKGASIFRIHNVAMNRDALSVADAIVNFDDLRKGFR